jgi:hypothetical protein
MPNDITTRAALALREEPTSPSAITELLHMALEKNLAVETLERLVALHERVTDRQAASEFATALAQFQGECPPISKTSTAKVVTQSGSNYSYTYAELSHIAEVVGPMLHSKGFSYSWDSEIHEKLMKVTCTLRHINGHKATASFACPTEARAGMSEQQKFAAALSYAKRMSLIQVLGITTADPDTDGANPEVISREQVAELRQLAEEVGADVPKFLRYVNYPTFEEITKGDFNMARTALTSKRKAAPK